MRFFSSGLRQTTVGALFCRVSVDLGVKACLPGRQCGLVVSKFGVVVL